MVSHAGTFTVCVLCLQVRSYPGGQFPKPTLTGLYHVYSSMVSKEYDCRGGGGPLQATTTILVPLTGNSTMAVINTLGVKTTPIPKLPFKIKGVCMFGQRIWV